MRDDVDAAADEGDPQICLTPTQRLDQLVSRSLGHDVEGPGLSSPPHASAVEGGEGATSCGRGCCGAFRSAHRAGDHRRSGDITYVLTVYLWEGTELWGASCARISDASGNLRTRRSRPHRKLSKLITTTWCLTDPTQTRKQHVEAQMRAALFTSSTSRQPCLSVVRKNVVPAAAGVVLSTALPVSKGIIES